MQNYLKSKYDCLYMTMAFKAAEQSVAHKLKVGACVVTKQGMISIGWNGTPSGFDNRCEYVKEDGLKTYPWTIHAEVNAIKKMLLAGVSLEGSHLYVTTAPCAQCASVLVDTGISKIIYDRLHNDEGLDILIRSGIEVVNYDA